MLEASPGLLEIGLQRWEEGQVSIEVGHPPDPHYSATRRIGSGDSDWDIEIPDRRIRGFVARRSA